MRRAVGIPQAAIDRDVASQGEPVGHAELPGSRAEGSGERAVAVHLQAPPGVVPHGASQDIREQQRVLLRVEPADAQHDEFVAVVAAPVIGGVQNVRRAQQGHVDREGGAGTAVVSGQLRPDDDDRRDAGQAPEDGLEDGGAGHDDRLVGTAVADEHRQVLAHPEHDAAPAQPAEEPEQDRLGRIGAEDPDDVEIAQRAPEPPRRGGHGPEHGGQVGTAAVMGERYELGAPQREGERVIAGIKAPDHHETLDVWPEPLNEPAEGELR